MNSSATGSRPRNTTTTNNTNRGAERDYINARLDALDRAIQQLDGKVDVLADVQARAPTRADMEALQKEQMRRETYEIAHGALVQQVTSLAAEIASTKATLSTYSAQTAQTMRSGDELHGSLSTDIRIAKDRIEALEKSPGTRRSIITLWLLGIGTISAILCGGTGTVVSIIALLLQGHQP